MSGTATIIVGKTANGSRYAFKTDALGNIYTRDASGDTGSTFINDTTSRTGNWTSVQVITAAVFDPATVIVPGVGGNTFTGVSIPAGTLLLLNFTTIKLTSGSVLAYNA